MKKTSLTILAAFCFATPAMACPGNNKACPMPGQGGSGGYGMHQYMMNMDANNDGKVSFAEFKKAHSDSAMKKKFETMDANGDGVLSADDKQARHQKRMDERFASADSNKDGVLSKEEFAATQQRKGPGQRPMKGSMKGSW